MPPPPPPPPPSLFSTTSSADRTGLLNEIGNFRKVGLKKAVTNDRSAPAVGGSSNNSTRNSTTNRSNTNERPSSTSLITPHQLSNTILKPPGANASATKVRKPSIPQVTPPPPPPVHQPVVKTPLTDQSRNEGKRIVFTI